jgi:hypothetical protein
MKLLVSACLNENLLPVKTRDVQVSPQFNPWMQEVEQGGLARKPGSLTHGCERLNRVGSARKHGSLTHGCERLNSVGWLARKPGSLTHGCERVN